MNLRCCCSSRLLIIFHKYCHIYCLSIGCDWCEWTEIRISSVVIRWIRVYVVHIQVPHTTIGIAFGGNKETGYTWISNCIISQTSGYILVQVCFVVIYKLKNHHLFGSANVVTASHSYHFCCGCSTVFTLAIRLSCRGKKVNKTDTWIDKKGEPKARKKSWSSFFVSILFEHFLWSNKRRCIHNNQTPLTH